MTVNKLALVSAFNSSSFRSSTIENFLAEFYYMNGQTTEALSLHLIFVCFPTKAKKCTVKTKKVFQFNFLSHTRLHRIYLSMIGLLSDFNLKPPHVI